MTGFGLRARLVLGGALIAGLVLMAALLVARMEIAAALASADLRLARADIAPYVTDLQAHRNEHPDRPSSGVLVAIRAPDGTWETDSMPGDVFRALGVESQQQISTSSADFVVARQQVTVSGRTWTIWAARDATDRSQQARAIDVVLIVTGVALLAVFAAASVLIVRGALRPVEQLRRGAEELGGDDLLPVPPGRDELTRLADTLNDLVVRTRESAAHERRMVGNAAHELRTPIANFRAAVDLARREPGRDRLDELAALADRLGDLAANLLELSRLDEGARPAATPAAEVEDAVLTAVDGWRTRLAGSPIDVDHDTAVDDPAVRVELDRVSAGRLVDNLVGNAVTALQGRGAILVTLRVDGSGLRLAVEDDGPGMPEAIRPIAFDRFIRGSSEGSGLGLALVRAIAEAGGGTARLEPLEPGLRVIVELPLADEPQR